MSTVQLDRRHPVVANGGTIDFTIAGGETVALEVEQVRKEYVERPAYDGPYAVTPGATAQTLSTNNKRMTADVVVSAIPNNYGLITWNGSFLTIS